MKIASTFHNAVAVPNKIWTLNNCLNCIFFDKSTRRYSDDCKIRYNSLGNCLYFVGSDCLPLVFIPQEDRTV